MQEENSPELTTEPNAEQLAQEESDLASTSEAPTPNGKGQATTTLAETSVEDKATTAPADWPTNWRNIISGGDEKALQKLNRYASPQNVWKALQATSQKISSGELLSSKPDGTDEGALNEWRAQAGIPEKAENYLDKLPDGLVIGEDDKERVGNFLERMHGKDVPPAHVHEALTWHYEQQEQEIADRAEADNQIKIQTEDDLRGEWGTEYRGNINSAQNVLTTYGDSDLMNRFFQARFSDGATFGNDPAALRFLVSMSKALGPSTTITPQEGKTATETIQTELGQLNAEMGDRMGPYWKGPLAESKQARWRELSDMQERLGK